MHGLIFIEFRKFVRRRFSSEAWGQIVQSVGLKRVSYSPIKSYSDSELFALVGAALEITGLELSVLLEEFGEYVAPSLIRLGKALQLVKADWKTGDILMHVADIHRKLVRLIKSETLPPKIKVVKKAQVYMIYYSSPRNIPQLAVGVIRGIGNYFKEDWAVRIVSQEEEHSLIEAIKQDYSP